MFTKFLRNQGSAVSLIRLKLRYTLVFTLVFYACYGMASVLADQLADHYRVDLAWEQSIPFIPEAAWVYHSLILLMFASVLLMRQPRDIHRLFLVLCGQVVFACIIYLLFPVQVVFPDRYAGGSLPMVFLLADLANLKNNYLPSLHVCFAFMSAMVGALYLKRLMGMLFYIWALLIAISTMLIHEHHFADVIGGIALALAGFICFVYLQSRSTAALSAAAISTE